MGHGELGTRATSADRFVAVDFSPPPHKVSRNRPARPLLAAQQPGREKRKFGRLACRAHTHQWLELRLRIRMLPRRVRRNATRARPCHDDLRRDMSHARHMRRGNARVGDGGDAAPLGAPIDADLHRAWQCWCICPVKDRSGIDDTVVALRAPNELGSSGFILRAVFGRHKQIFGKYYGIIGQNASSGRTAQSPTTRKSR